MWPAGPEYAGHQHVPINHDSHHAPCARLSSQQIVSDRLFELPCGFRERPEKTVIPLCYARLDCGIAVPRPRREQGDSNMKQTEIEDVLNEAVRRIVERFGPDRILLFGSYPTPYILSCVASTG